MRPPCTPPPATGGVTAPAGSCLRTRRSSRPRCSWTPRTPWCAGAGAPTRPGWPTRRPWRAPGRGRPVRISWPLSRPWPPVVGAWTSWSGPPAPARPPPCRRWWRPGRPSTGPVRSPPWPPPRRPPRSSATPWERRPTTSPCGSRCAAPPPSATATWTFCVRQGSGSARAAVWRTSATPSRSLTPPPRACPTGGSGQRSMLRCTASRTPPCRRRGLRPGTSSSLMRHPWPPPSPYGRSSPRPMRPAPRSSRSGTPTSSPQSRPAEPSACSSMPSPRRSHP